MATAGGTLVWSDTNIGVGAATSANPSFLATIQASNAFLGAAPDPAIQFVGDVRPVSMESLGINPATEKFWPYQWNMRAMQADQAWAAGCTGKGVRVAILDTGIWAAHPDLAPNFDVARSKSFVPGFAFNQDVGTFWHGTHVAGIVAAANVPGINNRVIGVAPEATLIGVKVLHNGSGAFSWIIAGIAYAATPIAAGGAGADIINMSLGATLPRSCKDSSGKAPSGCALLIAALNRVMNYAASKGVLAISAAGNDGYDFDHLWNYTTVPAESGNGIAVSATGPKGFAYGATDYRRFASYSNYGSSLVQVAAPGGDFALYPDAYYYYDMVLSTNVGGWAWAAGTSMATPAAAGVAALLKARYPKAGPGQLKNLLAQTADDEGKVGQDPFYGNGFVNAYKACTK